MGRRGAALLSAVAGAALVASCDDPRAPELGDEPPVEVNPDEIRDEGREAGRAIGREAEKVEDPAKEAGDRPSPEGERP